MSTLTATYSAAAVAESESSWLKLWQRPYSAQVQQAGFTDLTAMWYMALSGLSARLYRAATCPATISADGVVTVPIDFYVFPSSLGMQYSLSAGTGSIGAPVYIEEEKELDLVFDQQDSKELGYLTDAIEYEFLSGAYGEFGSQLPLPQVSHADGIIKLSTSCFCVIRIKCLAKGYRHRVTMTLTKYEPPAEGELDWTGYKIENLQNVIQATWIDGDELQSAELDLEIPPCVEDYLAECEDGGLKGIIGKKGEPWFLLFFSTCTGNKLGVRQVR